MTMSNVYSYPVSKTDMLVVDTMCHRLLLIQMLAIFICQRCNKALSYKSIVLSKDISILRICLCFGSIVTHQSHIKSEPTLIRVSSIINSETLVFVEDIFFGLYFCIHFQMLTWLLFTNLCNALAVFL